MIVLHLHSLTIAGDNSAKSISADFTADGCFLTKAV